MPDMLAASAATQKHVHAHVPGAERQAAQLFMQLLHDK
jgi:hypothetical protein